MTDDSSPSCLSAEVELKGLFLGPQSENQDWVRSQINHLLESWFEWRHRFRPEDGRAISEKDMQCSEYIERRKKTEAVLESLSSRFEAEIPKFSPRYIGHMFSETSLPALFGHILTLLHNPNNISGESSKVGVSVEEEAIQSLAQMISYAGGVGHFTSGGTLANFEAVYRARARCYAWLATGLAQGKTSAFQSALQGWAAHDTANEDQKSAALTFHPLESNPFTVATKIAKKTGREFLGPVLLVPEHKHYSWVKAANVFGLGPEAFWSVQLDPHGRLDVGDLERQILRAEREDRPIMMVVSVLGTTELGMIDPIDRVQDLLDNYRETKNWYFWHHIDAAYGGFLCTLQGPDEQVRGVLSQDSLRALEAVSRTTSLTIDPHKLGYVPYSSGAFLAATPRDYFQKSFGAPYVDFNVRQDKGPFTLEGSRSAAGAVATWMTAECIGLSQDGYGRIIARTILLKKSFEEKLQADVPELRLAPAEDSNLIGFCLAEQGEGLSVTNARTLALFNAFNDAGADAGFYISKTKLHKKNYPAYIDRFISTWQGRADEDEVVLIRLCIMNPFFKSREMKVHYQDLFVETLLRLKKGLNHGLR